MVTIRRYLEETTDTQRTKKEKYFLLLNIDSSCSPPKMTNYKIKAKLNIKYKFVNSGCLDQFIYIDSAGLLGVKMRSSEMKEIELSTESFDKSFLLGVSAVHVVDNLIILQETTQPQERFKPRPNIICLNMNGEVVWKCDTGWDTSKRLIYILQVAG